MAFNLIFKVKFVCLKFNSIEETKIEENFNKAQTVTFDVDINKDLALNFLFKFSPNEIKYNETYKFVFVSNDNSVVGLYLLNSLTKEVLIVANLEDVINNIFNAYNKILLLEKMESFLDYDFSIRSNYKTDENGLIDEFDIAKNGDKIVEENDDEDTEQE